MYIALKNVAKEWYNLNCSLALRGKLIGIPPEGLLIGRIIADFNMNVKWELPIG